jgi:hypothetical protein
MLDTGYRREMDNNSAGDEIEQAELGQKTEGIEI